MSAFVLRIAPSGQDRAKEALDTNDFIIGWSECRGLLTLRVAQHDARLAIGLPATALAGSDFHRLDSTERFHPLTEVPPFPDLSGAMNHLTAGPRWEACMSLRKQWRLFAVAISACATLYTITCMTSQKTRKSENLRFSISIEKEIVSQGEPAIATLEIGNQSMASIEIDLGANAREAFKLDILDPDDRIASSSDYPLISDVSYLGRRTVPVGGAIKLRLVLNQWCSTLLPPRSYTVRGYLKLGEAVEVATCTLTIKEVNPQELQHIFKGLTEETLRGEGVEARMFAMTLLAYAEAPSVVPFLGKVIRESDSFSEEAIAALGRIATILAVKELGHAAREPNHPHAKPLLQQILRRSTEESVKEQCEIELKLIGPRDNP